MFWSLEISFKTGFTVCIYIYIYIYIYGISSLRVNDLTLILITWRKWWAPNNASKQQMGFNSGFKGLIIFHACKIIYLSNRCNSDLTKRMSFVLRYYEVRKCTGSLLTSNGLLYSKDNLAIYFCVLIRCEIMQVCLKV